MPRLRTSRRHAVRCPTGTRRRQRSTLCSLSYLIRRVLDKLATVVDRVGLCKDGLPNVYSWKDLADVSADALVVSDLPAEASSSGSASSDSEATLT